MKARTTFHGIVEIEATLGDVPVFRLLQARCPNLRVEIFLGKRRFIVPLVEIDFTPSILVSLNKQSLPFSDDSPRIQSDLSDLGRRMA